VPLPRHPFVGEVSIKIVLLWQFNVANGASVIHYVVHPVGSIFMEQARNLGVHWR
jgi:hypothetical protein